MSYFVQVGTGTSTGIYITFEKSQPGSSARIRIYCGWDPDVWVPVAHWPVCCRSWLAEQSWEVVPLVCGYITPETEAAAPHFTQCCQDLLLVAAAAGNPKENLVAFLEQLDTFR